MSNGEGCKSSAKLYMVPHLGLEGSLAAAFADDLDGNGNAVAKTRQQLYRLDLFAYQPETPRRLHRNTALIPSQHDMRAVTNHCLS